MVKLKVNEIFGYIPEWEMYIVDFYRTDGETRAIVITDNGTLEDYSIRDLNIDYHNFIVNK